MENSLPTRILIGTPVMLYTQVNFYIIDFLAQFAANPFLPISIPGIHPSRLRNAIQKVRSLSNKINKGLSLSCPFDKISYRNSRRGFMFASSKRNKFYPLVSLEDVAKNFYNFWKSM